MEKPLSKTLAPTPTVDADPLWYKDAVIYQLHVKSFFDANNDGVGDFQGLISRLDYIANLGVNTVWLLPFFPSPRRDDGYDIADYRGVHPDYGNLADVRQFIRAAHERGLRVIIELVVNHTSDQHPWFQRARKAKPGSAARGYYVWSDTDQAYADTRVIFCDTEKSNWTWDTVANAYFWHRFYAHQPDLNYDNPRVLKEIINVMYYWLDMGVDGLRLDAVPYLVEREGTNNENLPETHEVLRKLRAAMDRKYTDRVLLAEANQWPEDAQEYFGIGDECHMSFHFPLMPRMYMAIARADRFPITDIMQQTPEIPDSCQWAVFLRNHDELTLEMVTSSERDYLWDIYAADRLARINLGIRRRLAPLLERDRRRIELMNSLLLSMPGTPVLYYGDELGMGDNIHLGDRDGVRTPMQWSPDRNGGFSRADPERLPLPVLMGPLYGYEAINVEAQQRDPHSLLNWTRRMLAKRQTTQAFGRGSLRFLFPGNRKILAYVREYQGISLLCVANLSNASQPVELDLSFMAGTVPVELLGGTSFPTVGETPYLLSLPPYGFYWFDLSTSAAPPAWHVAAPEQMPDFITLVLRKRNAYQMLERSRRAFCDEVLPEYLRRQRWFASGTDTQAVRINYVEALPGETDLFLAEVQCGDQEHGDTYCLPLALVWGEALTGQPAQYAMARVRRGSELGLMTDAFLVPEFAWILLDNMRVGRQILLQTEQGRGMLCFQGEAALQTIVFPGDTVIDWFHGEQSNSTLMYGDIAVLKLIRRTLPGVHSEAEMNRYLTQAGYANSVPLLGELIRVDADGTPRTLGLLHKNVANQGDAWTWTLDYLERILESAALTEESADDYEEDLLGYNAVAASIGRRLAQLHQILAQTTTESAFQPYVADAAWAVQWISAIRGMLADALLAADSMASLPDMAGADLQWLHDHQAALFAALDAAAPDCVGAAVTRIHGDFHLGQVLVAQGDVYLIDFEGEPNRGMQERRAKSTGWRDVAGVLRSFDYASAHIAAAPDTGALTGSTEAPTPGAGFPASAGVVLQQHRQALLDHFCLSASHAFLDAYTDGKGVNTVMLDLALLEKAAYEVCYEAQHRHDWIRIPLAGLARVSRRLLGEGQSLSDQETP